jgi:hypothetical protein
LDDPGGSARKCDPLDTRGMKLVFFAESPARWCNATMMPDKILLREPAA